MAKKKQPSLEEARRVRWHHSYFLSCSSNEVAIPSSQGQEELALPCCSLELVFVESYGPEPSQECWLAEKKLVHGRKNDINMNFSFWISCRHSSPLRLGGEGSKVSPYHRGLLMQTSMGFQSERLWPKALSKKLVQNNVLAVLFFVPFLCPPTIWIPLPEVSQFFAVQVKCRSSG